MKWEDDRLTTLSAGNAWLPGPNFIQRIFEDRDGVLWIGTRRSGLFQLADGQVRAVNSHQQRLSWLTEDSERGIWSASLGGGITRLQRQRFQMLYPESGDREIASTAVCEDRTGALWSADRSYGVVRYQDGVAQRIPDLAGSRAFYANSVTPDDTGHIWVGAVSGLYRTTVDQPGPLEPVAPSLRDIHVLHFSARGDLWIGSGYTRLGRLRQGFFDELTASRGYPGSFVVAIAETADGTTWVALEHQLLAYRHDRLVRETAVDGFASERLNALYGDPVGALWIGTSRGLLRLKEGRLTAYTQATGLPNERIEQLTEDEHGLLWIGSRRGFFHIARAELEAFAAGRTTRVTAVTFGPEEGLTGQVPVPNCQPDAWKGRDNRIWFCTQQGVLGIDANAVPRELTPPPVYVERVSVDGREVGPGNIRLQTGHHRLAFHFSSPNFAAPEKVRLRYRLRGLETEWTEGGSDQEASYADLPAGRYTLEVAASNPNGLWREGTGAAVAVSVVPAWRDTWWARGLAIAGFAGAVAGLARFTSHRLLKLRLRRIEQEHALEKERARIARDLHDELGGSLTQIRLLADRLRRRPDRADLEPGLSQLARQTRRLAGELESIIWTVNPRNNSLDRFARFILQFAPRFFRDTAIACTVFGVEKVPARRLAPEVQHHLLSATKEALANVLKHSEANLVVISLHYAAGILRMAIHDNGVGFDPAAAAHEERNGLSNMRSRLGEIGGVLEIHSLLGQGTTVSWQVPIPAAARTAPRATPALSEP
jgi:signal transduction histidine kinase/ligand-binding sensor domain-containing protein